MEQRSSLHGEQKRETKLSARVSRLTAFLDMGDVSLKIDEKLSTIPFPSMEGCVQCTKYLFVIN